MQGSARQGLAMKDASTLARAIKQWGAELGFQQVGIADCDLTAAETHLLDWLGGGLHGDMDYMARHGAKRSRPAELVPGTLRVIVVRMDYLPAGARDSWDVLQDGSSAYISRYALGRDYHKVMRHRLQRWRSGSRGSRGFNYRALPTARR
jgi:epoxyqueuosine reductase